MGKIDLYKQEFNRVFIDYIRDKSNFIKFILILSLIVLFPITLFLFIYFNIKFLNKNFERKEKLYYIFLSITLIFLWYNFYCFVYKYNPSVVSLSAYNERVGELKIFDKVNGRDYFDNSQDELMYRDSLFNFKRDMALMNMLFLMFLILMLDKDFERYKNATQQIQRTE